VVSLDGRAGGIRGAERRQARRPQALPAAQTEPLKLAELNDHVGYFLRRLQVALFKDFMRTLAPVDVRPAQYSVLILIAANPGRSQAAIGRALGIERARLACCMSWNGANGSNGGLRPATAARMRCFLPQPATRPWRGSRL